MTHSNIPIEKFIEELKEYSTKYGSFSSTNNIYHDASYDIYKATGLNYFEIKCPPLHLVKKFLCLYYEKSIEYSDEEIFANIESAKDSHMSTKKRYTESKVINHSNQLEKFEITYWDYSETDKGHSIRLSVEFGLLGDLTHLTGNHIEETDEIDDILRGFEEDNDDE
jgi:hypothetical protein